MGTLRVVELEPLRESLPQFHRGVKGSQIEVLILKGPPESLDEDIVPHPASAIHAHGDALGFQDSGKSLAGELGSLVCVEDLRGAVAGDGLLQDSHAELGIQGVGQPPGEHFAAMPVHDRHQEHKAAVHGNVGDIGCPDLLGALDVKIPQEVRIDLMARMPAAGAGLGIDGLKPHPAHESLDPLAVDRVTLPFQMQGHAPAPVKGRFEVLLVHQTHQVQICSLHVYRLVVEGRAADFEQSALP